MLIEITEGQVVITVAAIGTAISNAEGRAPKEYIEELEKIQELLLEQVTNN